MPSRTPPADPPPSQGESQGQVQASGAQGSSDAEFFQDPYDKVIVTASRTAQDPMDAPASVTVITAEDIRLSGAIYVADVLRRVVGVDVISMSSGVPYLGIRAFNGEIPNKVLWLVDGRPTYLDFLGSPLQLSMSIALEEIERIEVVRGPGSAIYGANAVTGVVNIITRLPGEGPSMQASFSYGYNQLIRGSGVASGGKGPFTYRLSAQFQQEGRWERELDVDELPLEGPIQGFRFDQTLGSRYVGANARFDARFADKGWASLSGGWNQGFSEYYLPGGLGNFGLDGQAGHLRADIAYGPFHARSTWHREDGATEAWLFPATRQVRNRALVRSEVADIDIEGAFDAQTGPVRHDILIGASYRYKQYRAGQRDVGFENRRREDHFAGFAQYQLSWSWLKATGSLRLDRHPLVADLTQTLSPRGALVFRVADDTSVRVTAGSAFRAMNALESYVNLEQTVGADGYFATFTGAATTGEQITLGPERITTVELGARDESSPIHAVDAVVFWNRITNLIDVGSLEPTLGYFVEQSRGYPLGGTRWVNDTDTIYDAIGGELDVSLFPVDGLDINTNLTLTKVLGHDPVAGTSFSDGSTALAHWNTTVQYRAPFRMDFSLGAHYVSKQDWRVPAFDETGAIETQIRPIPDRMLMSARIAGRPIEDPEIELAVTLWNPVGFAGGFLEHPDGQRVGARLFGTVSVAF